MPRGRSTKLQHVRAGALILGDEDIIRLARLALAGLPVCAARSGGVSPDDKALVEALHRAAEQTRTRITRQNRTRQAGSATRRDTARSVPASSATWPTTTEAAQLYQVSSSYLRRLCREGLIASRPAPRGGYLLDPGSLAAWAAGRTRTTP